MIPEIPSGRQCQACLDANQDCDLDKKADTPSKRGCPSKKNRHLDLFSHQVPPAASDRQIAPQSTPVPEGSEMLLVRLVDTDQRDVVGASNEGDNKVMYFGNDSIWSYSLQKARRTRTINPLSPLLGDSQPVETNVHHPIPRTTQIDLYANNQAAAALRESGAFALPPIETQRELVDAYFRWHYPLQPILDKDDFMRDFETGQVSILLLQALLSVATTCCDESVVRKHWSDRRSAQALFYRRARALYDADHEQDRVTIVQALFFMCHWWGSPTDVKDFSHWLSTSIHMAQVMGMHRS